MFVFIARYYKFSGDNSL